MKSLQIIACTLALSVVSTALAAVSPEVQGLLTEGQTAYLRGDLAKAKAAFLLVYQIDSRNPTAIGYLKRIKIDEANKPKGSEPEVALAALIVPKIEFHDATLREALDVLRKKAGEISGGKQAVNFVIPPGEPGDSARVTLSLQNVPFTEAVRYLGRVANIDFTFEKYAIVGKPTSAAASANPATTTAPAPTSAPAQ